MLTCQRSAFSLPDAQHYLNCAYMSPLPRRVEAAGVEGIRRKRVPSAVTVEDFFTGPERARELFARLIGAADPARVAIVPAVSYGIAVAARNTPVGRGRTVVVARDQFPSNVFAWRRLCAREGAELVTVAPPEGMERRGERWNQRLLEAIDARTAIVALAPVHWADGTRFDLEAIGARAREVGAALVVDGTQSVGALPFDVERVRPDALVCAGYKWLLGPYAIGLAYFGPRYDGGEPLEDTWLSRQGSDEFSRLMDYREAYRPGAARYDVGEASNFVLLPMLIAALEQLLEWGVAEIQAYCRELTRPLFDAVAAHGYGVEEEAWRAAHLFGLRTPEHVSQDAVRRALAARGVAVSVRGDAIRVSPHLYNDERDIAALIEALPAR